MKKNRRTQKRDIGPLAMTSKRSDNQMAKAHITETFLTPEERALRPVVVATEEIPNFSFGRRGDGFAVESKGSAKPEIRVSIEEVRRVRQVTQWRAHIAFDDKKVRVLQLGQERGHIPITYLNKKVRARRRLIPTPAFRPNWLDLRYHPRILPRCRRLNGKEGFAIPGIPPGMISIYRGELVIENDWPWCTIGKLFVGHGDDFDNFTSQASGVLVGPNLMLTASHAAPWDVDEWWMKFVPAYRDGSGPFGFSYVRQFRGVRHDDHDSDYVVCELYEPLGQICGWMGSWASSDDEFYEDLGWDSVGYPVDFFGGQRPAVEWNVQPEEADEDDREVAISFESPFTSPGWSGGPLFGWVNDGFRVVGISRGTTHYDYWIFGSDDDAIFTGGLHMVDLIRFGLANWPV